MPDAYPANKSHKIRGVISKRTFETTFVQLLAISEADNLAKLTEPRDHQSKKMIRLSERFNCIPMEKMDK